MRRASLKAFLFTLQVIMKNDILYIKDTVL